MANARASADRELRARPRRTPGGRPSVLRRLAGVGAALTLAPSLLLGSSVAVPAATATVAAAVPPGFVDETIVTGLSSPTNIVFAPGGRVFVAEKRGVIRTWASYAAFSANGAPTQTLDIRTEVMNYWDRGLLGIAVDPGYPGNPYLYILYSYDALPGGSAPHWNSGDPNNDACPNPPGPNSDGCVITNRLERVTVNTSTGVSTGRTPMLTGWCQQFPSHSAGSVLFGADGWLYVTAGEGASFNGGAQDYGQKGGNLPNTTSPITPRNPCGDPPGGVGGTMTSPTAEGGALRSQSFRRPGSESAVLNGAVLRLDPTTGLAAPGNPAAGDPDPIRQRIVAFGLRNPFRATFRPGTNDLYLGDVGYSTWEEVNRLADPTSGPTNFGWPCFEGPQTGTYYTTAAPSLCTTLSSGAATQSIWDYAQTGHMAAGDGCPPVSPATSASASISGLAFYTASAYPAQFHNALFVADYSRNCIVVLQDGGGGIPEGPAIPFSAGASNPVTLATDPTGNLVYADLLNGQIHRIRYQPPVASFTATPSSGLPPLNVAFNGGGSSAPAGIASYAWDFGDGATGTGPTTSHTYAAGTWTARLTITDTNGVTATTTRTIAADNTPPHVVMDSPTCTTSCWKVGDVITLTAHATDAEDGNLPASAFSWHVVLEHCHSASDCHEHVLVDPVGVATTTFVAPDHDIGSRLQITVTATDSGGLTSTATRDSTPKTTTVRLLSSPAGLPVSLDGVNGNGSVGPTQMISGHSAVISAAATATLGESSYAFDHWSDGGSLSHSVAAPATATTYTATYTKTGSDSSETCAGAPIQVPTGTWTAGRFSKPNDIDWIRFNVPSSGLYRIVLGGLPVDGVLSLYRGCSTLIKTVNTPSTHWEEIIATLSPGTHALRISSVGGAESSANHAWLVKRLSGTTSVLSTATVPSSGLRFVGDVLNVTTAPRSVTVTARMYSSSGKLLKTVSTKTLIPVIAGRTRSSFLIMTTRPTGYASVKISVTSTAATKSSRLLAFSGVTGSSPGAGQWRVSGMVTNPSSTTATGVTYAVTAYDAWGRVANATTGHPTSSTLAAHGSSPFTATLSSLSVIPPTGVLNRARAN